jgi:hypothetical protein
MRLWEECPYITPCGWCSRQNKPCERQKRKKTLSELLAESDTERLAKENEKNG